MSPRPVTLLDVLGAAQAGKVPLAPESAGYLALSVADFLLSSPRSPEATEIVLGESGRVEVLAGAAASDRAAEAAGRALLAQLLAVAGSNAPALLAASKRVPGGGVASFVRDLEAALIPVNRAAATRALARLHRETSRVRGEDMEVPYTPPQTTSALEATPTDRDVRLAFTDDPLEQDASIVIGEITMPMETSFDPSIPIRVSSPSQRSPGDSSSPRLPSSPPPEAMPIPLSVPPASQRPPRLDIDRGWEPRAPRSRGRGGTYLLAVAVVVGLLATVWVYLQFPAFFAGHR